AVAGMPPAAGGKPVSPPDCERLLDRLPEAVEGDDDVLADLAAAARAHGDRDAVAPAPEFRDRRRLRRRMHGERALAENLHKILAQALGLLLQAVGFCDDQEGRAAGPLGGEGGAPRLQPGDPGTGDAVLERVRSTRVRGDVAADLRLLSRTRIWRKDEPVLPGGASEIGRPQPCFDADPPEQRVERADARQPLETKHQSSIERDGSAREPGATTARDRRNLVVVAPGEHLADLLCARRNNDGLRSPED